MLASLLLALAVTACGSRGQPDPGTPAPGAGRFNLVRADFAERHGQLTHETRAPWVWTDVAADEGRLYGFQRAERADGSTLPPVAADLSLDPLVARYWLAAAERLNLRRGPGARPASLSADPGPSPDESVPIWLGAPLQPLVPWAQLIEGGRRARLGLSTEDGRPVFQLRLPASAFDDFEAGLEAALAAHDRRRAAAAAEAAAAARAAETEAALESTPAAAGEPPAPEPASDG